MIVRIANSADISHVPTLVDWYRESAKLRGVGIAERNPEYLKMKMEMENSVIAFHKGELAGFCYLEIFEDTVSEDNAHEVFTKEDDNKENNIKQFVVNSGMIVHPDFRNLGFAKKIKWEIFSLSRTKYPNAKIFSITTSLAVMRMNSELGYKPVTFSELTKSDDFWNGCKSCKNYSILIENDRKMCLCTGLEYSNLNDQFNPNTKTELSEAMKMKIKYINERT